MVERVGVYIDGYNLYYGIKAATRRRHLWLDVERLARELLTPNQQLEQVTYFTSRVRSPADSQQRQTTYLDALATHTGAVVVEGFLQRNQVTCRACGVTTVRIEEKKTDVHIACRMLDDAHRDRIDVALLISGDSDLAPALELVAAVPGRRIVVAFPPRRNSAELRRVARGAVVHIQEAMLRRSQLPNPVVSATGHDFHRPRYWQ
jgi:uncharacterized LabA/DUF88 family protein